MTQQTSQMNSFEFSDVVLTGQWHRVQILRTDAIAINDDQPADTDGHELSIQLLGTSSCDHNDHAHRSQSMEHLSKCPNRAGGSQKLFDVKVTKTDTGAAHIEWSKIEAHRDWATLSAVCYLLRTNVADWSDDRPVVCRIVVITDLLFMA